MLAESFLVVLRNVYDVADAAFDETNSCLLSVEHESAPEPLLLNLTANPDREEIYLHSFVGYQPDPSEDENVNWAQELLEENIQRTFHSSAFLGLKDQQIIYSCTIDLENTNADRQQRALEEFVAASMKLKERLDSAHFLEGEKPPPPIGPY